MKKQTKKMFDGTVTISADSFADQIMLTDMLQEELKKYKAKMQQIVMLYDDAEAQAIEMDLPRWALDTEKVSEVLGIDYKGRLERFEQAKESLHKH